MPVSYDARNEEIYREMTVCSRVKITRFHHNEQLAAHIFLMGDTTHWEKDRWYIAIYQPISGLSDMGKQVMYSMVIRRNFINFLYNAISNGCEILTGFRTF